TRCNVTRPPGPCTTSAPSPAGATVTPSRHDTTRPADTIVSPGRNAGFLANGKLQLCSSRTLTETLQPDSIPPRGAAGPANLAGPECRTAGRARTVPRSAAAPARSP